MRASSSYVSKKVKRKFVLVCGAVHANPTLRVLPHSLNIIIIIIIMNKSQETMVFSGRQKWTSAMKLRPEK